ncbi:Hypotetical protein [Gulosibacter molinativorax]|nr:Hypotetical protein [Gulosibacter molinativorax]
MTHSTAIKLTVQPRGELGAFDWNESPRKGQPQGPVIIEFLTELLARNKLLPRYTCVIKPYRPMVQRRISVPRRPAVALQPIGLFRKTPQHKFSFLRTEDDAGPFRC